MTAKSTKRKKAAPKKAPAKKKTRKERTEQIKKYQFKPGQSGNPKGRTKGIKNLTPILKKLLNQEIEAENLQGEMEVMQAGELLCLRLLQLANLGDIKAIRTVLERIDGKVPDNINFNDVSEKYEDIKEEVNKYLFDGKKK